MIRARFCILPIFVLLAACGSDPEVTPDAGPADTGADAGVDAGPVDSGPRMHRLRVDFGGLGTGRVTSDVGGLDCNEDCEIEVLEGTAVTLTATTGAPNVFAGWEGVDCGAANACAITVDAEVIVTARFDRIFTLTIDPAGDGLGVVEVPDQPVCFGVCDVPVRSDQLISIVARAGDGSEFVGWMGECSGPDPECRVGINSDKFVRPLFEVRRPQIVGQHQHYCALTREGGVRCWGRNDSGQLGWGTAGNVGDNEAVNAQGNLPVGVDVAQIAVGELHTCVLDQQGGVRCWGGNNFGQLGRNDTDGVGGVGEPLPASLDAIELGGPALQIAAGATHTCALMVTGAVRCWGSGEWGRLGYGNSDHVGMGSNFGPTPLAAGEVPLGGRATFIAAGGVHTCAVLEGGGVKCWGDNSSGQLGYGRVNDVGAGSAGSETPADMDTLPLGAPVQKLSLGRSHSCAQYEDRRVRCWGSNARGALGDGSNQDVGGRAGVSLDTAIDALLGQDLVVHTAAGYQHTCVSLQNTNLRCWGSGTDGAMGQGDEQDQSSPIDIPFPAGNRPLGVAAGVDSTCVATRSGSGTLDYAVLCWGANLWGQLGNGTRINLGDRPGDLPPDPSPIF